MGKVGHDQPVPVSRSSWIALAFVLLISVAILVLVSRYADQRSPLTTDILVLGDSQLSFGAGPVLENFFQNLAQQCGGDIQHPSDLELLRGRRFAMIGTRSTSLQSWIANSGRAWELLCHKDKTWGVNASAWGTVKPPEKRYVQIGEGKYFQFCRPPKTPLQNLFAAGYYRPALVLIFVGGNGSGRLARSRSAAEGDVSRLMDEFPANTGCIFMMTAPVLSNADNEIRRLAQANLQAAFEAHGKRCTFVKGHTPATRSAIEGQVQYFRRDEDGNVKDPHHANKDAAMAFLALRRSALCQALVGQLRASRADRHSKRRSTIKSPIASRARTGLASNGDTLR